MGSAVNNLSAVIVQTLQLVITLAYLLVEAEAILLVNLVDAFQVFVVCHSLGGVSSQVC